MENKVNKSAEKFGTRHVQILLLSLGGTIAYVMRSVMSVAIVAMTDTKSSTSDIPTFDWDSEERSLILSSVLWGSAAAQVPFGFLMTKYNTQRIMCGCIFFCSLMYLVTPVLAIRVGYTAVLCCTVATGLGLACIDSGAQCLLSRWAPAPERATLGSFVMSSAVLGTIFSMLFAGLLASSKFGWPSIFYVFGIVGTAWSILYYLFGANAPSEHPRISPEEVQYIEGSLEPSKQADRNKKLKLPWKAILKSLPVWSFLICLCGHFWSYYVITTQLPTFMKYVLNFDIQKNGLISALPYLGKWLLSLPMSWLSDLAMRRYGVSVELMRKITNTIGMWGPGAALLALCLVDTSNEVVVVSILVVAVTLNAGVMCGSAINMLDLCPNYCGGLYSILNTIGKVFGIIAPIACGAIVPDSKNIERWHIVFYISAAAYFFPNLVFILFGKAEKQPWNEPNYSDGDTLQVYTVSKLYDETKNKT